MKCHSFSRRSVVLLLVILLGGTCSCCHAEKKSWADIAATPPLAPVASVSIDDRKTVLTPLQPKTTTNLPPGVYKSLPVNVIKTRVRNVYDGDTLTLVDGRRVRFLGIDTPELDPPQAFGPEAKAYTKELCHKQDVYLDVQKGKNGTDKYGRLLAFVWVRHGTNGHFLNVNEGLVAQGLASVYVAKKEDKKTLSNFARLLEYQQLALAARKGIWNKVVERNVVVTKFGSAYHLPTCRHLAQSRNTRVISSSKAMGQGLHACRSCLADEV